MVRYVIGCLVVGLVLFLIFVGIIFALIYFYGGDIVNWLSDMFPWVQVFFQNIQN